MERSWIQMKIPRHRQLSEAEYKTKTKTLEKQVSEYPYHRHLRSVEILDQVRCDTKNQVRCEVLCRRYQVRLFLEAATWILLDKALQRQLL